MAQKVYCLTEKSGYYNYETKREETIFIGLYSSKELATRSAEKYIKAVISALDIDKRPNDFSYDLDKLFDYGIDISVLRPWDDWSYINIRELEIDTIYHSPYIQHF